MELSAQIKRPAGKIGISQSVINHIRKRHGKEIRSHTEEAVIDYVTDVLCNINEIREGRDGALILEHRKNNSADLVIVEEYVLEYADGFYRVKTARRSKIKKLKNKKLIMCGKNTM